MQFPARNARTGKYGIALPNENFALPRKCCPPQNFAPKIKRRRNNPSVPENPKKIAKIPKNPIFMNFGSFFQIVWNFWSFFEEF